VLLNIFFLEPIKQKKGLFFNKPFFEKDNFSPFVGVITNTPTK
jgi:hypothetical protein